MQPRKRRDAKYAARNITIGQYFPGHSFIHKMDPRMKLIAAVLYIIVLFVASRPLGMALGIALVVLMYMISGISAKLVVKSLKPVVPIIIFTAILNLFFLVGDGEPIFSLWFLHIYREGVAMAIMMAVRIMCLIAGTSLLTYTTSPIELTDAIEVLMGPLKKIKVPVHEIAMMMTIALRFIPTLIEETDKIMNAQKARGADMETGSVVQRAKALIPILIPLFVSAFRRADELALAMECRCYRGSVGRTRMKQLEYQKRDFVALAFMLLCLVAVIAINAYFPKDVLGILSK